MIAELESICSKEFVSYSDNRRMAYSRDSSTAKIIEVHAGKLSNLPDIVVWPKNQEEVCKILKIANKHRVPLVAYGGGSGVCGAAVPSKGGIVLDMKRMDQILKIDEEALTARIQTGILGEILERKLNARGYTLGHFPSSIYSATLGGYLACRSAGQLSTKYGKIEDMVQALTLCLADGRTFCAHCEQALALHELFLGSEGVLGVMTDATLKIHPLAEEKKYIGFSFSRLSQGMLAIRLLMQHGVHPAVVRLYDPLDSFLFQLKKDDPSFLSQKISELIPSSLQSVFQGLQRISLQGILSEAPLLNRMVDWTFSKCLLILGFEGPAWKVKWEFSQASKICQAQDGKNLGEEVGLRWLQKRYSMGYLLSPLIDQGCFADTMEVAAPWSKLQKLYEKVKNAISPHALVMAHFSHAYSDGCSIYFVFVGSAPSCEQNIELHRKIWDQALQACLEAGGTVSHHHGIGSLKAKAFVKQLGPFMTWFRKVKSTLDPQGILNPGKMGL